MNVTSCSDEIDCNDHGECEVNNGTVTCTCDIGYYEDDCKSLPDVIGRAWIVYRITFSVLFFISLIIVATLLVRYRATHSLFNVKRFSFVALFAISLVTCCLLIFDPFGFDGWGIPAIVSLLLAWGRFPILTTMLSLILLHWIELYTSIMKTLKREQMLASINKKYQPNVTLEDILQKNKFLKKLKWPFLIINVIGYLFTVAFLVTFAVFPPIIVFWSLYFLIMNISFAIGFFVYGRKLIAIMPEELKPKIRRTTRLVAIQAILTAAWIIIMLLALTILGGSSPSSFFAGALISESLMLIINTFALSLFIRVVPGFPFIALRGTERSSGGSSRSAGSAQMQTSDSGRDATSRDVSNRRT